MIVSTTTHHCPKCQSQNIVKNGKDKKGKQKYHCHDCNAYGTLNPAQRYSEERREEILRAYQERSSLRGIERTFGVARQTVASWIKKKFHNTPDLEESVVPAQDGDVLELDELWSFVRIKSNDRWIWIALCRRTRQVVAFVIGDRSEESCRKLWENIPDDYKKSRTYSDLWAAYENAFPAETHRSVGKHTGETSHVERWNNTLRQRISRFVRKTLSFSKSDVFHYMVTMLFIYAYNLSVIT